MESILSFLYSNKALLGGVSIAIATIAAVFVNDWNTRKTNVRAKRQQHASFVAAIASELIDLSQTFEELYVELDKDKVSIDRVKGQSYFDTIAYDRLLDQIGDLGSSLSFLLVDVYGDIRKFRNFLNVMPSAEMNKNRDELSLRIQKIVVKILSASIAMQLYADYLNGPRFMGEVQSQRSLWLKLTLDDFCKYVAKVDNSLQFIAIEDKANMPFLKRFGNVQDRKKMSIVLNEFKVLTKDVAPKKTWQAQLFYTALSLKIKNTLSHFLEIEPEDHDLLLEKEYQKYLSD